MKVLNVQGERVCFFCMCFFKRNNVIIYVKIPLLVN